jgi:hypothetical protein
MKRMPKEIGHVQRGCDAVLSEWLETLGDENDSTGAYLNRGNDKVQQPAAQWYS